MMEALVMVADTAFQGMAGPVMAASYCHTPPSGPQSGNRVMELPCDVADKADVKPIVSSAANIASRMGVNRKSWIVERVIDSTP
jgi:hypothetical protein